MDQNHNQTQHQYKAWHHVANNSLRSWPLVIPSRQIYFRPMSSSQWIGLRENLNRKPMSFYHQIDRGFRLTFSHHPIL